MIERRPTFRVAGYALLVLAGLTAALMSGRPEPAVLVTPFAVFLVLGLTADVAPIPTLRVSTPTDRLIEGDETVVTISSGTLEVEFAPLLPPEVAIRSEVVTDTSLELTVAFDSWGVFELGTVAARTFDPHRLWTTEAVFHTPVKVRVHPRVDRLPPHLVAAMELQPYLGHHSSRASGDGFDFADVRAYRPGDRARSVNWRASARRGGLWVNDRHPDRSSSVIVLLDTFGADRASRLALLEHAVQAVAAIAEVYGRVHDHVGLLTFGGQLRWLKPAGGRRQLFRIVDALLDAELLLTDVWSQTDRVPVGVIPPGSLLLAVTPLQSDTSMNTLIDLRARGFDVAAVTHAPVAGADERPAARLGHRLDALSADARRLHLERAGVATASADISIAVGLRLLDETRRRAPRVRV